jgi:hypothetical protein
MRRRDKLSFLYHYVKGDVKEMFYKNKQRKTVCILVHGYHTPLWEGGDDALSRNAMRIKHIAWNYFGLKAWIVMTSQKDYWLQLKEEFKPKPGDIYGITRVKKYKVKILKQKAKR